MTRFYLKNRKKLGKSLQQTKIIIMLPKLQNTELQKTKQSKTDK